MKLLQIGESGYDLLIKAASSLQSPLLLVIRLYWGWQFFVAGSGKLKNMEDTISAFRDQFHIPFPEINAYLAACTECFGGLLLLLGLASRLAAIPLCITMIVAYLAADMEALKGIFSKPDDFVTAAPFLFLFASFLVLVFGPGIFSLDYVIKRWILKRPDKPPALT